MKPTLGVALSFGSRHLAQRSKWRSRLSPEDIAMEQPAAVVGQVDRPADRASRGWLRTLAGVVLLVMVWCLAGPILGLSDTWQLFISTSAAVVVFWMVLATQADAGEADAGSQARMGERSR
jgi:predicted phage tail protein